MSRISQHSVLPINATVCIAYVTRWNNTYGTGVIYIACKLYKCNKTFLSIKSEVAYMMLLQGSNLGFISQGVTYGLFETM